MDMILMVWLCDEGWTSKERIRFTFRQHTLWALWSLDPVGVAGISLMHRVTLE